MCVVLLVRHEVMCHACARLHRLACCFSCKLYGFSAVYNIGMSARSSLCISEIAEQQMPSQKKSAQAKHTTKQKHAGAKRNAQSRHLSAKRNAQARHLDGKRKSTNTTCASEPVRKKPASAPSTSGWEEFAIVPYTSGPGSGEEKYEHLQLKAELKKAPAVVKHIQNGTLSSPAGCTSVKDFLRSLEKKGDPSWLNEWNQAHEMSSHENKKAIMERLKMELDQKNLLIVVRSVASGKELSTTQVRGWMALWEVADVEKIPFKPENAALLRDLVANEQSKPHPTEALAQKGWRVYWHVKNSCTKERIYSNDATCASQLADGLDPNEYTEAVGKIAVAGGMHPTEGGGAIEDSRRKMCAIEDIPTKSSAAQKWKQSAQAWGEKLGQEEDLAASLEQEITSALENGGNPALQKKHAKDAARWAVKLRAKKAQLIKSKGMASYAKAGIFDKEGNKFDEYIEQAKNMLDDWEGEENKQLMIKLLRI